MELSLTRKTISGAVIRMISLLTKGVLQLFVLIFFARYISPSEFGVITIVTSILVFINLFTEVGLGPALIQRTIVTKGHVSVSLITSLVSAILIYGALYVCAPLIAKFYHEPRLVETIRFTGISILFYSLGIVSQSLLQKEMRFKILMFIDISSFLLSYCLLGVLLAILGFGLWSYVWAIVVQSALTSIFLIMSKSYRIGFASLRTEFFELIHFAGGLTAVKVFNAIGRQGDVFVTGRILGMNLLGIYGRANQLMDIPNQYIGQALDNALFPAMAKIQENKAALAKTFLRGMTIVNLFLFPLSCYMFILSPEIVFVVFGPKWNGCVVILQILLLALPFKTSVKLSDSLLRALGKFYEFSIIKIIYAVMVITLVFFGSRFGLKGVAIGTNLAVIISYALMKQTAKKFTGFTNNQYYSTYLPGLMLAAVVAISNIVLAGLLRHFSIFPPFLILILTVLVSVLLAAYLLVFKAKYFGETWVWLYAQLLGFIPDIQVFNNIKNYLIKKT